MTISAISSGKSEANSNTQEAHFVLSLQAAHTFSGLIIAGKQQTIFSTACPMFISNAHARRRTETAEMAENCGE
ncbi:MAG: hypothetical protein LBD47_06620 [Treponema sp.]|nr:hypothetical protein [Treponema sp.]